MTQAQGQGAQTVIGDKHALVRRDEGNWSPARVVSLRAAFAGSNICTNEIPVLGRTPPRGPEDDIAERNEKRRKKRADDLLSVLFFFRILSFLSAMNSELRRLGP